MRLILLLAVLLLPLTVHAQQGSGHIPEFPDIDLRWSRNDAIVAFARYDIGRLDSSSQTVIDHTADMRRFLASWLKQKSSGVFAPDLKNFQCEIFRKPITDRPSLRVTYLSLCFLNNAVILVNAQYGSSVSDGEITADLDRRYKRSIKGDFWFQGDKNAQDQLIEVYFHDGSNLVSYLNVRYYLSLKDNFAYRWQWDDGKKDLWDDPGLFPHPK